MRRSIPQAPPVDPARRAGLSRPWLAAVSLALSLAGLLAAAPAAEATTRAIVVGIDDYKHDDVLPDLGGATNDARDLAGSFKDAGVEDVTLLLDAGATRNTVFGAWQAVLERAQPGDRLFFTYAGHGMRKRAAPGSTEADGFDEFLPLHNFTVDQGDPDRFDMMLDDEIYGWVQRARKRGVEVVLVIDACHSGTSYRSVDPRTRGLRYRFSPVIADAGLFEGLASEAAADDDGALPGNLQAFGASNDSEQVPEVYLPSRTGKIESRGAMSYFFARGLLGAADADHDGVITFAEMKKYTMANIAMESGRLQHPSVVTADGQNKRELFALQRARRAIDPIADRPVHLKVLNGELPAGLEGIVAVAPTEPAELIWDAATREVVSGLDAVVAHDIGPELLQTVVDKRRAQNRLASLAESATLDIELDPEAPAYAANQVFAIEVPKPAKPYLVVVNLANDGTVQLPYPYYPEEFAPIDPEKPFDLKDFVVEEPFGSDLLVVIAAERKPAGLISALQALEGQRQPLAAAEEIRKWLTGEDFRLGMISQYTCRPGVAPCR